MDVRAVPTLGAQENMIEAKANAKGTDVFCYQSGGQ
jgi:hypothetical protein